LSPHGGEDGKKLATPSPTLDQQPATSHAHQKEASTIFQYVLRNRKIIFNSRKNSKKVMSESYDLRNNEDHETINPGNLYNAPTSPLTDHGQNTNIGIEFEQEKGRQFSLMVYQM
jgi:hypothetical protein